MTFICKIVGLFKDGRAQKLCGDFTYIIFNKMLKCLLLYKLLPTTQFDIKNLSGKTLWYVKPCTNMTEKVSRCGPFCRIFSVKCYMETWFSNKFTNNKHFLFFFFTSKNKKSNSVIRKKEIVQMKQIDKENASIKDIKSYHIDSFSNKEKKNPMINSLL